MGEPPLLPDLQIGTARDGMAPSRPGQVQRHILTGLWLFAALTLSILAWSAWDGIRSERVHLDRLSQQASALAAAQLTERLAAAGRTLSQRLDLAGDRLDQVLAGDDGGARLRELIPGLVAVRVDRATTADAAAGRDALGLSRYQGRPHLAHRSRWSGTDGTPIALTLLLRCGDLCSDAGSADEPGLRLLLVGDGGRWPLSGADGAPPATASQDPGGTAGALPVAAPAAPDPVAGTRLAGIPGWWIEAAPDPDHRTAAVRNRLLITAALAALVLLTTYALSTRVRRQTGQTLQAQRHLKTNRRKLAAVLDSTTEGIVLADTAGTIELLNPAAEVMFGQLGEDVIGHSLGDLLPELADAETQHELAGGARSDIPLMREVQGRRADDGHFPARTWLRRLPLDDGDRLLVVIQDLTENVQNVQKLTFLEQRDVLTGLLNRKEFERRMQRHLAEAAGSGTPHVLCYIDVDQFKVINDTVGHAAGDALVEQLATLITVRLDDAALLARLGGDEFGALFVDCTERDALDLCEGLMQTVRNFLFTWRDRSFDVAVSIGVTAFQPENDSAAAELAKADVACHMAKHDGRDRIHVYRDGDTSVIRHHGNMHLVSTISQALSSGRFRLYGQPIMPLGGARNEPRHHEVLVRMLDEQGEPIRPEHFIPAAEQYILMPAVDRWIIHELLSTRSDLLRAWQIACPGRFLFAVNLSGTSVTDDSFLPYLRRQFEVHQVPAASICFEITETAAMRDLERARAFMQQLTDMGASFALDDFGSGLSSYNYLRELPVSYLKIDGSFVRDMNVNPVNHALVASINQVAHVLGLKTIAEWAEDASTINQLRALNVDYVQGYAIGEPAPLNDLHLELPGQQESVLP